MGRSFDRRRLEPCSRCRGSVDQLPDASRLFLQLTELQLAEIRLATRAGVPSPDHVPPLAPLSSASSFPPRPDHFNLARPVRYRSALQGAERVRRMALVRLHRRSRPEETQTGGELGLVCCVGASRTSPVRNWQHGSDAWREIERVRFVFGSRVGVVVSANFAQARQRNLHFGSDSRDSFKGKLHVCQRIIRSFNSPVCGGALYAGRPCVGRSCSRCANKPRPPRRARSRRS